MHYKYYTPQIDEEDCGVAALSMVLKTYGSNIPLARLRSVAKTTVDGTTIYGIVQAAKRFNLDALAIKGNETLFSMKELPCPFIIHIIKGERYMHYCVVTDVSDGIITIADPDESIGVKKVTVSELQAEWQGVAIFFSKNKNYVPIKERTVGIISFTKALFKNKRIVFGIVSTASAVLLMNIMSSLSIQIIIDQMIPKYQFNILSILVLGLIMMYFFNSIFSFIESVSMIILGQRLSQDMVLSFINHLFKLPIDFFATRKIGDIITRFSDTNKVIEAFSSSVVTLFLDVIIVLVMGIVLGIQNLKLLFIVCVFMPIYIFTIITFSNIFEKANKRVMEKNARVNSLIIDNIKGMETLKSLNAETSQLMKIESSFKKFLFEVRHYGISNAAQESIKLFLQQLLNILVIWIGANQIMQHTFKVGQLIAFSSLLGYFTTSLKNILDLQAKLQSAKVANERLKDIMVVPIEKRDSQRIYNTEQLVGNIIFDNVCCRYGYQDLVLKDINLKLKEGEKIALVGSSGSGKSTIAKLLVGFLRPSSGGITINGIDIDSINKESLRSYIGYVPQKAYTIPDTLWNNITLGCSFKNITKEKVDRVCRIAMLDEVIGSLPLGYNTMLDEEATILSGGQKQRITIARALLSDAKVLILDESTGGLDVITEKKIIDNLLQLKDRTIIFIAHRLSIAKAVDNIIVLNNGKVVEKGTHNELMKKHKYYFQFVRLM